MSPGTATAWCGEVHPALAAAPETPARVLVGEIDLERLASVPDEAVRYRPTPRFPRVVRDLAVVLDPGVFSRDVLGALACVPSPAPVAFDVVDRYVGPPLAPAEVCLTVRVILEPDDRTLTEVEIEGFRGELLKALERGDGFRPRVDARSD